MKIKRSFEMSVATNRRYIIRQSAPGRQIACAECSEPMLRVEQAAGFFGIKQRRIFQIIETEAAHFTEVEADAVMICLSSLAAVLDGETHNNSRPLLNTTSNTDQIKNVSLNLTTNNTALTSSDISANVLTEAGRQN